MSNRRKESPSKKLNQFDSGITNGEADSDLEAELAEISSHGAAKPNPEPAKTVVSPSDLDKMVADSLKDIGSDEELSGDEDDSDLLGELQKLTGEEAGAENVVSEATEEAAEEQEQVFLPTTIINIIDTLKERIQMYELAEANAKAAEEACRIRRFDRGLKKLKDMLKQASSGKNINVEHIPPEVSVKGAKPLSNGINEDTETNPLRPAPSPPT